jgi:hypothetical protein
MWESPDDIPHFPEDNPGQSTAWTVKGGIDVCSAVVDMLNAAWDFPQYTFPYDPTAVVFWNSNSAAWTIGVKGGFLWMTPPPRSPGWGKLVPW